MKFAPFGRTGLSVPRIAFGAMTFGEGGMAPGVRSGTAGASKPARLTDNLGALEIELTAEEIAALDVLSQQKARYPNRRWLPDNLDPATSRAAIGKR